MILVTYDLNIPGQKYDKLTQAIESRGNCYRCLKSTWLLRTRFTVVQVFNYLRQQIDDNDFILVVEVNPDNLRGWLDQKACNWIDGYVNH
jgi:hypothetical protein